MCLYSSAEMLVPSAIRQNASGGFEVVLRAWNPPKFSRKVFAHCSMSTTVRTMSICRRIGRPGQLGLVASGEWRGQFGSSPGKPSALYAASGEQPSQKLVRYFAQA
jgi:hypothetical protein